MSSYDPNDPDMEFLCLTRQKQLEITTISFDGKKNCWVPDEKEGFLSAEIQSTKGDEVTVKVDKTQEVSDNFWIFFYIIIIRINLR